ncbi:unnamed protein product, partial [Cyprideis torosa]
QGYDHDVEYGNSKIFIRSPRTLFQLEEARTRLIPAIVTFIQKLWRGTLTRWWYKKLRAALTILHWYRRMKIRKYIFKLQDHFRNVRQMPDFGKHLRFPPPPIIIKDSVHFLHKVHRKWWAFKVLERFPRAEWPQLRLKILAADVLLGKRIDWGYHRQWEGNYLAKTSENPQAAQFQRAVEHIKQKDGVQQ